MRKLEINEEVNKALALMAKAERIFRQEGVNNITQPGLLKEMKMAAANKHNVVIDKHLADAIDDAGLLYEYLSCQIKNKSFAIDCMFSRPNSDLEKSLKRISRNDSFYCGVFDGLNLIEMYKVSTRNFLDFTKENLKKRDKNGSSMNREHTISYPLKWVKRVGEKVEI
jgi:hypothetical protein